MVRQHVTLHRRLVLKGAVAAAALTAVPGISLAQSSSDAVLFTLADMHSPYARLPAILDRLRSLRAEAAGRPTALLINGDIFERGNAVALRSGAAADWAFLSAVAAEMPVYVNLGNHETAILDDMATFVARADQAGIHVISNLLDRRTDRFFAPVAARIGLGGIDVSLLGLAATNPFVYRQPVRDTLTFLNTAQFVADAFADSTADADLALIMSHAGVSPDRSYIDGLPAGTVIQGAHDHLTFDLVRNDVTYFHGSSWGTQLGVLELAKGDGVSVTYRTETIAPEGGDAALAEMIAAQKAEHLTAEDTEVIAEIPQAMDMHNSILVATDAVRLATEADIAVLGHTTFGAPLAAGPLTRYDFDAFVRFGGGIRVANIPGRLGWRKSSPGQTSSPPPPWTSAPAIMCTCTRSTSTRPRRTASPPTPGPRSTRKPIWAPPTLSSPTSRAWN